METNIFLIEQGDKLNWFIDIGGYGDEEVTWSDNYFDDLLISFLMVILSENNVNKDVSWFYDIVWFLRVKASEI